MNVQVQYITPSGKLKYKLIKDIDSCNQAIEYAVKKGFNATGNTHEEI